MKRSVIPNGVRNLTILFFFSFLSFMISSCYSTYTYVSNVVNEPMIDKKDEIQAAGYVSFNHAELQTAYSPTNHLLLMANGYLGNHRENFSEAGCGYYKHFENGQFIEFIGGYGYGNINVKNLPAEEFTRDGRNQPFYLGEWENHAYYSALTNYHRGFSQAGWGFSWDDFGVGLTCRSSYVYYPRYHFEYIMTDKYHRLVNSDILNMNNFSSSVIDPALTVKLRGKVVCFTAQFGYTFPLSEYSSKYILHPMTTYRYISTGIQVYINARKEKHSEINGNSK